MKTTRYFVFNTQKRICLSILPIIDFGFENYYKYYTLSIEFGWLCFGIYFEFKIDKRKI